MGTDGEERPRYDRSPLGAGRGTAMRNFESVGGENGFALILVKSRHHSCCFDDPNELSKVFANQNPEKSIAMSRK